MFEKVTNILADKISKENLLYCFFRRSIERQNLFSSISILSVRHYENIPDKLKISNLCFMIFIVQINKVLIAIYKNINLTTLGSCRMFLQQSKVSSVHLTHSLKFPIDS